MRRQSLAIYLCISFCLFSTSVLAKSTIYTIKTFGEIEKSALKDPAHTLVVMDNDDTLTKMPCPTPDQCQYIGGAAWFSWQEELLKEDTHSPHRVADTFQGLLDVSALLFSMSRMDYVEPSTPKLLKKMTNKGVRLMVETARGSANLSATEMQLSGLKADKKTNLLKFIKKHSLIMPESESANLPGKFLPCEMPGTRPVSYQSGVMYVAGQDKGLMLECLLLHYNNPTLASQPHLPIKHIIFIDDTKKNVVNIHNAFKNSPDIEVKAYHYIALDKHKKAFMTGPEKDKLQKEAAQAWNDIQSMLKKAVVRPAGL